jgi:ATP-dependent DNA helicase Q4
MTATVTELTLSSICNNLQIDTENVVRAELKRENLILSVSRDHNPVESLFALLSSETYKNLKSIIIYVMKQKTADELSLLLQNKGYEAASYHASKPKHVRASVQDQFMQGKLRIIVATIAFGMGLNKEDVRAVIHLNIPRSFEQYVQEIGRAGRDGKLAYCHTFFNEEDVVRHRSLVHSDGVDLSQVLKLLKKISEAPSVSFISIEKYEKKWDMRAPVIETLLSILQKQYPGSINLLPNIHSSFSLSFHRSTPEKLSKLSPIISQIVANINPRSGKYFCKFSNVSEFKSVRIRFLDCIVDRNLQ